MPPDEIDTQQPEENEVFQHNGPDPEDSADAIGERLKEFTQSRQKKAEESQVQTPDKKTDSPSTEVDPKAQQRKPEEKVGKDGMTKEERKALLEYKSKAETAESRIKELEELVKSGEATKAEVAELKKREADWQKKYGEKEAELKSWLDKQDPIALEKVRSSEEYRTRLRNEVDLPTARIEDALTRLCQGYDIKLEDVVSAHYNPNRVARNKALSEIKATMDDESKSELTSLLGKLEGIDEKNREIRELFERKPMEALSALEAERKRKADLEKERENNHYSKANDYIRGKILPAEFPELAGDADAVNRVKEKAEGIKWDEMTPEKRAYLAHGAFIALELRDKVKELTEKLAQAEASISKFTNKPGLSKTHSAERVPAGKVEGGEDDPQDVESSFARFRQSRGL